jgi:D-alanyl-D-alanine carboxypeptidase (penicillin-binding protein 5/6)
VKLWRAWVLSLCTVSIAFTGFGQAVQTDHGVRPTGVTPPPGRTEFPKAKRVRPAEEEAAPPKAKRAQAVDSEEEDAPTPKPKAKPKPKRVPRAPRPAEPPVTTTGGVPNVIAKSVLVIDARTGQTLYEKNADEARAAASTQKLLTALIIAEHGFLNQTVRVERIDTFSEPINLNIKAGDTYQRLELLRALLVKSPNDVARCLARDHAGSVEAFAAIMNQRARELGATRSNFMNPNGLPMPGQYSTARDLSLIARAAYANPVIRSIVSMPQYVFRFSNGRTRELENTNKLLKQFPYCNGMKTGYTEAAGRCLIASAARPGREIIVVVLGDTKARVWRDVSALLSWGLWM